MTDKTEAQPEALRLAEAQRYSDVVHHANVKASLAYVARKSGLGYQETERLLELALQRGDLAEGDYAGRKMENAANDQLASLEAQLVIQTNRAAAAEQQVTALTQRLAMANRLNTDARSQLAQLSARQAAPDGWRLVPVKVAEEMHVAAVKVLHRANGVDGLPQRMLDAMLSAAPPQPELDSSQKYRLLVRGVDTIELADEFLKDDGVTWVTDPKGVFVGITYRGDVLLPARRPLGIGATNVNL